jgi:hypothetical protein
MPKALLSSFVLFLGEAAGAHAQDAVKVDPEHHKVEFETRL